MTSDAKDLARRMATPSRMGRYIGEKFFGTPYNVYPWILKVEARVLGALADPRPRIIILNVPPQNGKTSFAALLAAWYIGMNPFHQVLLLTYSDLYSGTWGEKTRQILERWGPELFDVHVSRTLDSKGDWKLSNGFGGMASLGIGSGISGRTGHLILIDDLIASMTDAASIPLLTQHVTEFDGSIGGRFQDAKWRAPDGEVVSGHQPEGGELLQAGTTVLITATRFAENDLSGTLIERSRKPDYTGTPIEVIAIPAIAEAPDDMDEDEIPTYRDFLGRAPGEHLKGQFGLSFYVERRASLSDDHGNPGFEWGAVYQQDPSAREGGMFPRSAWRFWNEGNWVPIIRRVRVWDLATTEGGGDYTVGTLMGIGTNGHLYVLARQRGRWSTSRVEKMVLDTARSDGFGVKILIEQSKEGAGIAVVESFQRMLVGFIVEPAKAIGTKEQRATSYSAAQQINKVWLPQSWEKGHDEAWIGKEWIEEHRKMMGDGRRPRHDDQIDTGAYGAMDLLGQGAIELWLPHEHSILNRENVDVKLLTSEPRDPDEPRKQTSPFAAGRKALLAGMR